MTKHDGMQDGVALVDSDARRAWPVWGRTGDGDGDKTDGARRLAFLGLI